MGGRDQRAQGGDGPPRIHHSPDPHLDRHPGLHRGPQLGRHDARDSIDSGRLHRGTACSADHARELLGLGRDGLHLDLRHRDSGRDSGGHLRAAAVGRRKIARGWRRDGGRKALSTGAHDDAGGDGGPFAGGDLERHWRPDPEAARHRRHRGRADSGHSVARAAAAHARARASPLRQDGARMKPSVLVIDDEKTFRIVAEEALDAEGYEVSTAASGEAGLRAWEAEGHDVVVLDRRLPDIDGLEVLQRMLHDCRERGVDSIGIMAPADAHIQDPVHALKTGAFDYLAKPVQLPDLVVTVRKAMETLRLRAQLRQLSASADRDLEPLGVSAPMKQLLEMVEKVAQVADTTVLIQGESGTGKELVARMIHRRTPRRGEQALVEINCASLPEELLESELFGYEKGAFTDAKSQKRGMF